LPSEEPDARNRQTFNADEGPQTLGQMMAEGGARVVGSDAEAVGELKDQRDTTFTVDRGGLKRDLHLPVTSVAEILDGDVIKLEVKAEEAEDIGWTGSDPLGKAKDFSEAPIREGLDEVFSTRKQERGGDKKDRGE